MVRWLMSIDHMPLAIRHEPCQNIAMRIAFLTAFLLQLITPAPKPGHAAILSSPAEVSGKAGKKLSLFVDVTPKPGIHVFSPKGAEIKYIPIPEDLITNCAFGGPDLKTLYVTAGKTVFRIRTEIEGTRR